MGGRFGFRDRGAVDESAAFAVALELTLAVKDVQHGLHRGVGEVLCEGFLHGTYIAGAETPDDLHDLELELGEDCLFAFGHGRSPS